MYVPPWPRTPQRKPPETPRTSCALTAPTREFFVGIDSDGCAFNSMEVKHNDSFSVNLIKYFGLQGLSRQVHQAWDFVNLYSQTRGCNRFKAIVLACDELRAMPRVQKTGIPVPELPYLQQWIKSETQLGNPRLKEKIAAAQGAEKAELELVYEWSRRSTRPSRTSCTTCPPSRACARAWPSCASAPTSWWSRPRPRRRWTGSGPSTASTSSWRSSPDRRWARRPSTSQLAAKGKFPADQILMVGDAPGDFKAARDVGALFFPINPGDEEASWERFLKEGIDRFFGKRYAGAYEAELMAEFDRLLPRDPPWKTA